MTTKKTTELHRRTGRSAAPADPAAIAARIRTLRRKKAMTLEQFAQAAGFDRGYLSRVERGEKTPSIAALLRIAAALEVQMAHLFGEAVEPGAVTIVRHADYKPFPGPASRTEHRLDTVLPATNTRRLSAYLIAPGASAAVGPAEHAGEELLFVMEGQIEIQFADRTVIMDKGDCIHFDGHLQHALRRHGSKPARAFILVAQDLHESTRTI